jgi:hypothetical protein
MESPRRFLWAEREIESSQEEGAGVEDGDTGRVMSQLPVYSIMTGAASRIGAVIL